MKEAVQSSAASVRRSIGGTGLNKVRSAWPPAYQHENKLTVVKETSRQVCKTALSQSGCKACTVTSLRVSPITQDHLMPHTFLRQQRFFTFALLLASRHRVFCKSGLGSDNGPERRTPVPSRALPAVTSAMTRSAASLDELDCEPLQPNQCRRGSSEGGWPPSCFVPEAFIHLHSICVRATCPGYYRIGWRRTAEDSAVRAFRT